MAMAYGALVERTVPMSRKEFFARLADFGGIKKFMPEIESVETRGEGVGSIRTVTIKGIPGGMMERLEALVDGRLLSYSIINETPLPMEHYHAVVELDDAPGGGTRVRWGSHWVAKGVDDATVRDMLVGLYERLIAGIAGTRGK
jgi:polyketide cyclase/dehydrase/lipid transport protein